MKMGGINFRAQSYLPTVPHTSPHSVSASANTFTLVQEKSDGTWSRPIYTSWIYSKRDKRRKCVKN